MAYEACAVIDCPYLYRRGGKYCSTHRNRLHKRGTLDPLLPYKENRGKHPLYRTYIAMKSRCSNPNVYNYKNWGGRGIKVCDRWLGIDGFTHFVEDMGERPKGYSLDRIDNDGNYEPGNCRWATWSEQNNNKRNNKKSLDTTIDLL